ncbi:MAG: hypothetical protein KDD94_09495 [Calditrichaeota bacterium]|nr:hypothetical protein [Calditrichota bacterium]
MNLIKRSLIFLASLVLIHCDTVNLPSDNVVTDSTGEIELIEYDLNTISQQVDAINDELLSDI